MSDWIIDEKKYMEKVSPDTPVTEQEYKNALIEAYKARTVVCYMIWKKMRLYKCRKKSTDWESISEELLPILHWQI